MATLFQSFENSEIFDIVVVGSCIIDLLSFVQRLPKPGETLQAEKFVMGYGGKGANQCVTAAFLGAKTSLIAKIGKDAFGQLYLDNLSSKNINTSGVSSSDELTGMAFISVDKTGQNSIIVAEGANKYLNENDVESACALISQSKVLVIAEIPLATVLSSLKLARQHKVRSIFNAAPARADTPDEVFTYCDILCVNETESEILTGKIVKTVEDAKVAAKLLLNRGCQQVIVTLGQLGAVFTSNNDICHVETSKVDAVDTTGAGDAFIGSLAYYLALMPQLSMHEIVRRSCQIASKCVTRVGTQTSFHTREELPSHLFEM